MKSSYVDFSFLTSVIHHPEAKESEVVQLAAMQVMNRIANGEGPENAQDVPWEDDETDGSMCIKEYIGQRPFDMNTIYETMVRFATDRVIRAAKAYGPIDLEGPDEETASISIKGNYWSIRQLNTTPAGCILQAVERCPNPDQVPPSDPMDIEQKNWGRVIGSEIFQIHDIVMEYVRNMERQLPA